MYTTKNLKSLILFSQEQISVFKFVYAYAGNIIV